MKFIMLLSVMALVAADPKYYMLEKLDMIKLINTVDDLKEFTNCLLEKVTCNNVYESYRVNALEAIQQACKRCTPDMKHDFWIYLEALKTKLLGDYLELRHKYDPENKYFDIHEAELRKYSQV